MRIKHPRFLEIIPGATVWMALLLPFVLSIFSPAAVATFILLFDFYWLSKTIIMTYHLIAAYLRMKKDLKVNWLVKSEGLKLDGTPLRAYSAEATSAAKAGQGFAGQAIKNFRDLYQAVILATYKEDLDILMPSIQSIVDSQYPKDRIIFVLATEERDRENARHNAKILQEKFGQKFLAFLVTEHPANLPGEVKAKGGNVKWAAKKLQKFLDEQKISYDNVIVSTADADTRFHPQYFACLAYKYAQNPNRTHRSFQPIPIYANNIWKAPALSRISALGASFWQMIEATRPWRLINFSTHSMSMQTLVEIDFWDTTVVNEDSRQFWRAYFAYQGDHEVVPIFVPVYMDAVLAESYFKTLRNQYLQKRRWAYGVEHFPYVVTESLKHKEIPWISKGVRLYRLFEGNFSWATTSLFIALVAWLPLILNPEFRGSVLGYNLPVLARNLLTITWIGLVISATLSTLLLPPRPRGVAKRKTLEMILQWVLVPITAIFFSSFPAIDAQTRLMLGKYLAFRVTEKKTVLSHVHLESTR